MTKPLPDFDTPKQAAGRFSDLSDTELASLAIAHVLGRIRDDGRIAYLLGHGSQAFDLLTEAHARLTGQSLIAIRAHYQDVDYQEV